MFILVSHRASFYRMTEKKKQIIEAKFLKIYITKNDLIEIYFQNLNLLKIAYPNRDSHNIIRDMVKKVLETWSKLFLVSTQLIFFLGLTVELCLSVKLCSF